MFKFFFTVLLALGCYKTVAQTIEFKKIADLPDRLIESSGLEYSSLENIWTVVDSNFPILYCLGQDGSIKRAIHLNNVNHGWEDLAKDKAGNFYIGDFGNNLNKRRDLKIYKIPPPDSILTSIVTAEIINFTYEDQREFPPSKTEMNFDMDAMVHYKGALYLFSKNRTVPYSGYTKLYSLPDTAGHYKAQLLDSIKLGNEKMLQSWVTGAALSPDEKMLALLTHDKVWIFTCFKEGDFFGGKIHTINLNHFSQKEGICFSDSQTLFISDERTAGVLGGSLYKLIINKDEYRCKN
jgi:hypothetical protein